MITSVTLGQFPPFVKSQTIPLEALTVLVGPSGSGKTALMRELQQAHNLITNHDLLSNAGDEDLFRGSAVTDFSWVVCGHRYYLKSSTSEYDGRIAEFAYNESGEIVRGALPTIKFIDVEVSVMRDPDSWLCWPMRTGGLLYDWLWNHPELLRELVSKLQRMFPDLIEVHPGFCKLEYKTESAKFSTTTASAGLLAATVLITQLIDAEPESMILVESPERYLHPQYIPVIVDLFREIYTSKKCQFIVSTHSPVFLNELRDEPESILLFRKGPEGTLVTPLSESPWLVNALHTSTPGELFADGFFNDLDLHEAR